MRKKKVIIMTNLVLIIVISCLVSWKIQTKNEIDNNGSENPHEVISLENRIILADILKKENDILITEGNVDNTEKIIEEANIKEGVYIQEASKKQFLEILSSITGKKHYTINSDGYLVKNAVNNEGKTSIEYEIDKMLESKGTLIISIDDSYKAIINGMQLDIMIERTNDVEIIEYDDSIKIAIINSRKLNDIKENPEQVYENILMSVLENNH